MLIVLVIIFGLSFEECVNPTSKTDNRCNDKENVKRIDDIYKVELERLAKKREKIEKPTNEIQPVEEIPDEGPSNFLGEGTYGKVLKIRWGDRDAAVKKMQIGKNIDGEKISIEEREIQMIKDLQGSKAVVEYFHSMKEEGHIYIIQEVLFDPELHLEDITEEENSHLAKILNAKAAEEQRLKDAGLWEEKPKSDPEPPQESVPKKKVIFNFNYMNEGMLYHYQEMYADREKLSHVIKIAEKVSALHDFGYVHQDLKPANVMATDIEKTDFKLIDLGYAVEKDTKSHGQSLGFASYSKLKSFLRKKISDPPIVHKDTKSEAGTPQDNTPQDNTPQQNTPQQNTPQKNTPQGDTPKPEDKVSTPQDTNVKQPQVYIYDEGDEQYSDSSDPFYAIEYQSLYEDNAVSEKGVELGTVYQDVYAFALMMCEIVCGNVIFNNIDKHTIKSYSIEDIGRIFSKNLYTLKKYTFLTEISDLTARVIFHQTDTTKQITDMKTLIDELKAYQTRWLSDDSNSYDLQIADANEIGRKKSNPNFNKILI